MILEAIEDYRRGWKGNEEGLGGERVTRGRYAIEHIMPRKWQAHWPPSPGTSSESGREQLIHTLGNLTLLTSRLNAKVSNGPWSVKRVALKDHDVLKLNMDLLDVAGSAWSEDDIRARTERLVDIVIKIWPVPEGHRSSFATGIDRPRRRIEVSDLISSGLLDVGATLYARRKRQSHRTATVLADGRIDVDGVAYASPSAAAGAISGGSENGWWFFLVSPDSRRSLTDVWRDYVDQTSIDVDEGDMPEEEYE
jgi:hypothetical protein